jgi:hypothetical protein
MAGLADKPTPSEWEEVTDWAPDTVAPPAALDEALGMLARLLQAQAHHADRVAEVLAGQRALADQLDALQAKVDALAPRKYIAF